MKNILIVVDMQNDFISGSLGTREAEAIVGRVVKKVRSFDGPVIFTRDTHTEHYPETAEGRKLPISHCIRGTQGWELHPALEELRVQKDAVTFDKITFGSKELAIYLSDKRIRRDQFHHSVWSLYGYLRDFQCFADQSVLAGGSHSCGFRLLCRSDAG